MRGVQTFASPVSYEEMYREVAACWGDFRLHLVFFFKQKTAYEIVVLPITIRVVKTLKKHEGEDVYDNGISYNVFKIFSLN